jgi:hypothetical protein
MGTEEHKTGDAKDYETKGACALKGKKSFHGGLLNLLQLKGELARAGLFKE